MRLKEVREKAGFDSARKAAEKLNVPYTTYKGWESGVRNPEYEALLKIADVFGVSLDYLAGRIDVDHTALPLQTVPTNKTIPVLGLIRAGLPLLAEENYSETITVGQFERGADFALRVTGDSMAYAGVREGDIVLMQQSDHAQSGQIVAATVHDMTCEATLKYFVTGKRPVLRAANPSYPDQEFTGSHRIIGVFCGLVRTQEPSMHEYQALMARADALDEQWRQAMAELTSAGLGPQEVVELIRVIQQIKK